MASDSGTPRYTREEVEEILRRAAERTHAESGTEIRHDDLVAAAREAGIDVGAVEVAADELSTQREERKAVEQWDQRRRRRWVSHFMTWLVVNGGLALLDLLTSGGTWFFWPAILWGIFVMLHGTRAFREPTPEQVEHVSRKERRRIEAERKREARRQARQAIRERVFGGGPKKKSELEEKFERVVEVGVGALLDVVTRKIEEASGRREGPVPDSEFNRYVARQRGAPAPSTTPPEGGRTASAPNVRVEGTEPEQEDEAVRKERAAARARR